MNGEKPSDEANSLPDVIGGILFAGIGLFFFLGAFDNTIGTANRMGSGFFPMVVGGISVVVGLVIALRNIRGPYRRIPIAWRAVAAVVFSMTAFVLTFQRYGIIPGVLLTAGIAALGDRDTRLCSWIALMLVAATGAWVIFSLILGMRVPAIRGVF